MPRAIGISFQFLPEPHDMRIHGPGVREGFIAPNRIEDHVSRERAVGILKEEGQQIVLRGSKFDFLAPPGDDAALDIDLRFRKGDDSFPL